MTFQALPMDYGQCIIPNTPNPCSRAPRMHYSSNGALIFPNDNMRYIPRRIDTHWMLISMRESGTTRLKSSHERRHLGGGGISQPQCVCLQGQNAVGHSTGGPVALPGVGHIVSRCSGWYTIMFESMSLHQRVRRRCTQRQSPTYSPTARDPTSNNPTSQSPTTDSPVTLNPTQTQRLRCQAPLPLCHRLWHPHFNARLLLTPRRLLRFSDIGNLQTENNAHVFPATPALSNGLSFGA